VAAVIGLCQIFTITGQPEIWNSEKLAAGPSLPEFQVFTNSDIPEILPTGPDWERMS
jgi:hypothetical protein